MRNSEKNQRREGNILIGIAEELKALEKTPWATAFAGILRKSQG